MPIRRIRNIVPQSIRGRVLSLALLPLLGALLTSLALFFAIAVPEVIDDRRGQLSQTAAAQGEFFRQWREERFRDLRTAANPLPVDGIRLEAIRKGSPFQELLLYGRDGLPREETVEILAPGSVYLGDREYFRRALGGMEAVSEIIISRVNRIPVLVFAEPVIGDDGRVDTVLIGTVAITDFLNALEKSGAGAPGETVLVTEEGRVISDEVLMPFYRSREEGLFPLELIWTRPGSLVPPEIMDDILLGAESGGPYRNRNGILVVAAYETLVPEQWYLIAESPIQALIGSARTYLLAGTAMVLFFLLIFIPLLRILSRTIEEPILRLAEFSREVNRESYRTDELPGLPENAPREIRALFATFGEMVIRLREHMRDLERVSITDPLSGLANRRFLFGEGQRVVSMSLEHHRPVSVLMIDIDFFKRINDEFGHEFGDRLIERAAATISAETRETDLTARYGGEEFTVVAPFAGAVEAHALGERIRRACGAEGVVPPGTREFRFTVSVGAATLGPEAPERGDDPVELFQMLLDRADKALYRAKREGRDRLEVA